MKQWGSQSIVLYTKAIAFPVSFAIQGRFLAPQTTLSPFPTGSVHRVFFINFSLFLRGWISSNNPGCAIPDGVKSASMTPTRSRFRGLTLQLPSAVRVRLRLPLRPCNPAGPAKTGGTAPPGVAEYVNNGGIPMQYAKPVTLNVEECDRLSFLRLPVWPGFSVCRSVSVLAGEKTNAGI